MNKKVSGIILGVILVILFCGGCGQGGKETQAISTVAGGATIKDSAGRVVKIPAQMKRVIALNVSTFNMITAIGAADTVIGVNDSAQKSIPAAADKEVFATLFDPMVEKIIMAKPDAVITNSNMKPELMKKIEDAGIPVVVLEFYLPSILAEEVMTLGRLFKREEGAQKYLDFVTKYKNMIEVRLQGLKPSEKVTVYFEGYSDYGTVAQGTGGNELVVMAGGINITGESSVKYPKVSNEWVLQKNPQVIVKTVSSNNKAMGEGYTDKAVVQAVYDKVRSRIGWSELTAVKNNKVLLLSQNIGTTPEGSIVGMLYMAKMMYPDKFTDVDPYAIYKEMEQEFFRVTVNGIIAYPE